MPPNRCEFPLTADSRNRLQGCPILLLLKKKESLNVNAIVPDAQKITFSHLKFKKLNIHSAPNTMKLGALKFFIHVKSDGRGTLDTEHIHKLKINI